MAQVQRTGITGSLKLGTTSNTSVAGAIWYSAAENKLVYSYQSASVILTRVVNQKT